MNTSTPTQQHDPYLSARRAWNEQFGGYIAAARNWRRVAMLALLLAVASVVGLIWFAGQPRLIPYLVEVDGNGTVNAVHPAQRLLNPDIAVNVLRFQLGRFIQGVRSVSPDIAVQKNNIRQVYALLSQGYPAYQSVGEWFRDNSPLKRAEDETVSVLLKQILPLSPQSWRLEWREQRRGRNGSLLEDTAMTGTVTVLQGGEVTEKNLLLNPTGLYVTHFEWQQQLGSP